MLFALALFLAGASDAITDVAQNTHGLRVQRRFGRSIINFFHAVWSIGAVIGGVMGAAAIALGVPVAVHLGISTVVFATIALVSLRFCLPGPDEQDAQPPVEGGVEVPKRGIRLRVVVMLAALTLVAMAGGVAEDAGNSWATIYLAESLGAHAAVAPLGFIALVGAQFVGRMMGDRMTDRFGARAVARSGGLIAATGMGLALAFPSVPGTIAGFAVLGFGIATLIPAAMHAADEMPGLRAGVGLTIVSWLLRLGFLLSPPFVGFIAENASLRTGLLVAPIAGIIAAVFATALDKRTAGT